MPSGQSPAGGGWAYVSLASLVPGRSYDPAVALTGQFLGFTAVAVGLAAWYGRWELLPLATAAIAVSTAGSGLMVALDARVRALDPPPAYRRLLFDASLDVVMGLVAFIAFLTYLLLEASGPAPGFLGARLGEPLPALAVAFTLVVAWDLSYRIGTAWWAGLTGLWRTVAFGRELDRPARAGYVRTELLVAGFAALQLLLVPFLWPDRLLALLVLGHVAAVLAVSALSIGLLRTR